MNLALLNDVGRETRDAAGLKRFEGKPLPMFRLQTGAYLHFRP
jgi:hypothetical protein